MASSRTLQNSHQWFLSELTQSRFLENKVNSTIHNSEKLVNPNLSKFSSNKMVSAEETSECLRCLWPFLAIYRILGNCPISRHGNEFIANYRIYKPHWYSTILGLGVVLLMVCNAVRRLSIIMQTKGGVTGSWGYSSLIFFSHVFITFLFMVWKVKRLPAFLAACHRIETVCRKYQKSSDALIRQCLLLFYFGLFTQVFGLVLFYGSIAKKYHIRTLHEFLSVFNTDIFGARGSYYSGIFVFLGGIWCHFSWSFGCTLLGLISLILTRYFDRIHREFGRISNTTSLRHIEQLRCDYREVCNLVKHCNDVFAPLFLLTYIGNGAYLFIRLFFGFSKEFSHPDFWIKFESAYALVNQIFIKMFLPSYFAARLHEKAQEGSNLVRQWRCEAEGVEPEDKCKFKMFLIGRFLSHFRTTEVGISICGYFTITQKFLATFISAIITYEVIILQFQTARHSNPKP